MPMGHRWRGGAEGGGCPRRIHRFLEPCLLLLLHCNEAHGYELLDGLKQFGFGDDPAERAQCTASFVIWRIEVWSHRVGIRAVRAGPAALQLDGRRRSLPGAWVQGLRETDRVLHPFWTVRRAHGGPPVSLIDDLLSSLPLTVVACVR